MFPLRDTQPSYRTPYVTMALIAINVLVFLYEITLDPWSRNEFVATYGLVPDHFAWVNVLTSMFLHGGWMHLLGNMWFLWIFGDNIEDVLGHGKYLLFYLGCGAAAALTQTMFSGDSRVPMVGASGAIAGVMGAYVIRFPHSRILSLVTVIFFFTTMEIPAWVMLIFWFVTQFFNGVGAVAYSHASEGGIAFFAHIGGFVAGAVLILLAPRERFTRRRDLHW